MKLIDPYGVEGMDCTLIGYSLNGSVGLIEELIERLSLCGGLVGPRSEDVNDVVNNSLVRGFGFLPSVTVLEPKHLLNWYGAPDMVCDKLIGYIWSTQ